MKISKKKYKELLERTELKKSAIKYADVVNFIPVTETAVKGKYLYDNNEDKGILKRTIVANTYNWLDSHGDVHLSGVFSKSLSERARKIPHLHDHKFELEARVGKPIQLFEKEISWRELGQGKTGMTQALFMETEVRRAYNEKVFNDYLNDEIDQHSVAMRYIKVALAVNDEEEYPKEYEVWQENIGKIGNKAQAEEQGFFWAVSEAQLIEVSAVLLGSNELTPTLGNKSQAGQPLEEADEPLKDTRLLEAINNVKQKIKF